jgi:aspartate kinase
MLQEMAECGAKVVCAQAVEWARRAGIAIYARSTFDAADGSARETIVRKAAPDERLGARAVVAEGNVVLARIDDAARLSDLLRAAEDARVSLKDLSVSARGGVAILPLLNVPDWQCAKKELAAAVPALELAEDVAVASVVGDGFAATTEPLVRFLAALRNAGISELSVTATPLRLGAVIPAASAKGAQRALHAAFVA